MSAPIVNVLTSGAHIRDDTVSACVFFFVWSVGGSPTKCCGEGMHGKWSWNTTRSQGRQEQGRWWCSAGRQKGIAPGHLLKAPSHPLPLTLFSPSLTYYGPVVFQPTGGICSSGRQTPGRGPVPAGGPFGTGPHHRKILSRLRALVPLDIFSKHNQTFFFSILTIIHSSLALADSERATTSPSPPVCNDYYPTPYRLVIWSYFFPPWKRSLRQKGWGPLTISTEEVKSSQWINIWWNVFTMVK